MSHAKAPAAAERRGSRDVPERIGKYVIINEVGQGSTGRVFLSHDPYYGRDVAIKLYNIESEEDEQKARVTRKMFFNEAQMMGRLQHPNILPIYDAGEENGAYYVVTEHVHGARTLNAYCRPDNLLRIDDVVEILFKCAKGLHYAHGRGVVHRDIKPSNIMLTLDNDVRIIDFGIALIKDSDVSRIEGIAGSPSYMSPEQVRPFRANSLSKLLHQIVYATPPPIHTLRDGIPEEIENVVTTALLKEPEQRFASAIEFAGALTKLHQKLRSQNDNIDRQEQFDLLRKLRFFHDFSHAEIWEVLRASEWCTYQPGDEIIREGELDDRFYIIVTGSVSVESGRRQTGVLADGDCFGEASYVRGARRTATIKAISPLTLVRVSSTLLEQSSSACQLRFNKVFLRSLIERLQGIAPSPAAAVAT
jgi:tRNA A-37 threonylcarbamoyl transferase component Bud32